MAWLGGLRLSVLGVYPTTYAPTSYTYILAHLPICLPAYLHVRFVVYWLYRLSAILSLLFSTISCLVDLHTNCWFVSQRQRPSCTSAVQDHLNEKGEQSVAAALAMQAESAW